MEKSSETSIRSIPFALIVWLIALSVMTLFSAFICSVTKSPMQYTALAAKFCIILSSIAAGISVRGFGGGFVHALLCSALICAVLFILTMTGDVKTENIITAAMNIPAGALGYLLPAMFGKSKKTKRRRKTARR